MENAKISAITLALVLDILLRAASKFVTIFCGNLPCDAVF